MAQQKKYYFFLILSAILSLYLFFYPQVNSGFSRIFGDEYDSVIESVLVSHWYHVFQGEHRWNQPLYFYPYDNVLGYNDAYFLYGLIAAIGRVIGFNLFVSQELTHVLIKALGFFSMAMLLDRLQDKKVINIFGASLFTLCISTSIHANHGQLISMALSPLLTLFIWAGTQYFQEKKSISLFGMGCLFILVYSAWLMTSFYSAWFYGLFLIIYGAVYLLLSRTLMRDIGYFIRLSKGSLAIWGFLAILSVVPFLLVYLPKLSETGGQHYSAQMFYSLHLFDVIHFGTGSLIWRDAFSEILRKTVRVITPEHEVGFTPDVFVVICVVMVVTLSRWGRQFSVAYRALAYATLIGLMLPLSFYGKSLWYFVAHLIPGGSGVRVIARFYLFLVFPLTILISLFMGHCLDFFRQRKYLVYAVATLLLLSQINRQPDVHLYVDRELSLVQNSTPPPRDCKSFFVQEPVRVVDSPFDQLYRQNLQAMLLADHWNLPTLNGFATFNPPDWIFERSPSYLERVGAYVASHQLSGVCSYDIKNSQWTLSQDLTFKSHVPNYSLGNHIDFSSKGIITQELVRTTGWSSPEPWGVWSNAKQSVVILRLDGAIKRDLHLTFRSHGFLTPMHPHLGVNLLVNGRSLRSWTYQFPQDIDDHDREVDIPAAWLVSQSEVKLEWVFDAPMSPAQMKINGDRRSLGIGLVSLVIR